jgi:serine/threonine protein kinase
MSAKSALRQTRTPLNEEQKAVKLMDHKRDLSPGVPAVQDIDGVEE